MRNDEDHRWINRGIRIFITIKVINSVKEYGTELTNARQDLQVTTGPGRRHIYKYTCLVHGKMNRQGIINTVRNVLEKSIALNCVTVLKQYLFAI